MIKSIKHLRASQAEWEANDIVIPDGEIALIKTKSGNVNMKIGNGIEKFSDLTSLFGCTVKTSDKTLTLYHGRTYRLGLMENLNLNIPQNVDDDYYCEISFDSGSDATELSVNGTLRLTGDDVADEELLPKSNVHYTICIWYDGEFQGVVRGLPNA